MKHIIIGAGPAGVYAAKTIRENDPAAEIKIFTEENHFFYSRPKLTLKFLADKCTAEDLIIFDKEWFSSQNISLFTNTKVSEIRIDQKTVILSDNSTETYDKLLIATGSTPRKLPVPGADLEKVMTIRTIEDIEKINQYVKTAKNCTVVGGGLLGLETAYALLNKGVNVNVLEFFNRLLPRQTDEKSSQILQKQLTDKGLIFYLDEALTQIEQDSQSLTLTTKKGTSLKSDLVIMSAGIMPSLELTKQAGIKTDKGIITDKYLQTSAADVYAAGDCLEFAGRIYGFWTAAMAQGVTAGKNMCGDKTEYAGTTVSASVKVADIATASLGDITQSEGIETYEKISSDNQNYMKVFLKDNILIGAIMIGDTKQTMPLKKLIETKEPIANPEKLI